MKITGIRKIKCERCGFGGKVNVEQWEDQDNHGRHETWEGYQCPKCGTEYNSTIKIEG